MPTNLSTADASFPQLTEKQSTDEKIEKIQSYLYMLLESLRFQLTNLDKENFNDTAFEEISDIITDPVYAQISDVEGNVTSLALKADGLSLQIQNAEGDISTLVSRADILASQMTDAEGNISTLTQQSDALTTRVSNNEGDISSLQQTATSLSSRITSAENTASAAISAVNGISLSVSNAEQSSTLTIKSGSTTLDSATIKFTGDIIFAGNLTDGKTQISGDNITTGTISAITLSGNTITGGTISGATFRTLLKGSTVGGEIEFHYGSNYGNVYGGIRLDDQGAGTSTEMARRMFVYTKNPFALKLDSETRLSIEADWSIYIASGSTAAINLSNDGTITIGNSGATVNLLGTVKVNGTAIGG